MIRSSQKTLLPRDEAVELFGEDSIYRNYPNRRLMHKIASVLESLPVRGRLLDAGCGRGELLFLGQRLGYKCVGFDNSPERVSLARRYSDSVYLADLEGELPFGDQSFETVLCCEVLEHLKKPQTAIGNLVRVLKAGGYLILSVPSHGWWRWLFPLCGRRLFLDQKEHLREYSFFRLKHHESIGRLIGEVTEAGLSLISFEGVFIYDLPGLGRLMTRLPFLDFLFDRLEDQLVKRETVKKFSRYFVLVFRKPS